MVDSRGEVDLCRFEWVIGWEMDVQEVDTSSIRRIIWSHDGGLPVILVLFVDRSSGTVGGWVFSKINELLLDSLDG